MKTQAKISIKLTLLIMSVLFIGSLPASEFYHNDEINTLQLIFADDNWDADLDALYKIDNDGDGNYDRLLATAIINGNTYESVGVRYKGNSSYDVRNTKNPLNIKLDHVLDQEHEGYGTLKLSNAYKDPSFVRETLSYEIARKYMAASQANYMNVYVYNHSMDDYDYLGLYTSVEAVDKKFFSEHLQSGENARFKCNASTTWSPNDRGTGSSIAYVGSDPSLYYGSYQLKSNDPNHWQDLVDLAYGLQYNSLDFENLIDVDRAIWMLAFNNVLANLDSYTGPSKQNYYLYQNHDGRWVTVLWDLNESFGVFPLTTSMGRGPDRNGSNSLTSMDPLLREGEAGWPLLKTILGDPSYKKMYIAHMKTILEENFTNGWYETRAFQIQATIDAAVRADTNKFYSYYDFMNNVTDTCQGAIGITELMDSRTAYLNSHASLKTTAPVFAELAVSPENPTTNSRVWITAEVSNANSVTLAYRYASTGKFQKTQMIDDGNNNDGVSGDSIYAASLSIVTTDVEYYLYAENDSAAMFSPERAEHEYYTIDVSSTALVINEFMADNDTTIQDPDGNGGYPDWIELYNPGSSAVDLGGMYLTDDLSEPDQCQIPSGVSIEAGDYLLFWADNDEDQGGTHLSFSLSKSGEAIGLFDTDANGNVLIDAITFGFQSADISYGRITDGNDIWESLTNPSPGSSNR